MNTTEIINAWAQTNSAQAALREAAADGLAEWRAEWVLCEETRDRALAYVADFVVAQIGADLNRLVRACSPLPGVLVDLIHAAAQAANFAEVALPFAAAVLEQAADEAEVSAALDGGAL